MINEPIDKMLNDSGTHRCRERPRWVSKDEREPRMVLARVSREARVFDLLQVSKELPQ